ncbi:mammalian cell entry protein [Mycobacterium interjectum]|uniref:mammalian cell entry protein n=1 Tax=Mycobacterium interjectum TaxID=33895 RepID=UPI0008345121|nr:mammalian cell entry protein [Mycobacterium interjectum]MCV7089284.1 mammalian cell entry protein [Mycobacterium interjectum]
MENQQPAAGDLTTDAEESTSESALGDFDESTESATESAETSPDEGAENAEAAETGEAAKVKRPRRKLLAGKRLAIVVTLAAMLFVGSAAFAGAMVQPYLTDRASAATKLKVAQTAANAITTLWTYTPENMDGLADRAAAYLSGDFEAQYRKFVDAIVAPNKQAKVSNHTEVTGAAVESLDDPNAVVIVYTNTTSTSPLTKNIPSLKYLSYRLFMKRAGGRWLVTRMTTITSLDLTPQV